MNLRMLALKTDKLSKAFLRPGSNLLYLILDGKNEFLKKLQFVLRRGIFNAFLVKYSVRLTGIKLKRY